MKIPDWLDPKIIALKPAYEQARQMCVPTDGEIGGIILRRGLVPIPNNEKKKRLHYRPALETVDLVLRNEPANTVLVGVWHTHCRDVPPSKSDLEMAHETWEACRVYELVITPARIFLIGGNGGIIKTDSRV